MDLGRVAVQVQVLDPDVDELTDPRPGEEEGLDQEPASAAVAIGVIDEPLHLGPVQAFDRAGSVRRRGQADPAAHLLDDVLGLVVAEVVLAPEPRGLADCPSKVRAGWRDWFLTAPSPRFPAVSRVHRARLGGRMCAVSLLCAIAILTRGARTMRVRIQVIVEAESDAV